MDKKDIEEFRENVKQKWLVINRIPEPTRTKFIELANQYFAGDYGQTLKWCFDEAMEYQFMKSNIFDSLILRMDYISQKLEGMNPEKPEEKKVIQFLSGKKVEIPLNNKKEGD